MALLTTVYGYGGADADRGGVYPGVRCWVGTGRAIPGTNPAVKLAALLTNY